MTKVTSILYPGQERGGDFKPHGGFRFDGSKPEDIVVKTPIAGKLQDASKYMEDGEVQYMIDFVNPCGIIYRLDHLVTLSPKFAELDSKLIILSEDSWKTGQGHEPLRPGSVDISVEKGETIATAVGFRNTNNVFVDFGVYDLRGKGTFQNPRPYAVCWFDWLPPEDAERVKSLPSGDSQNGTKSTLCK